MLIYAGTKSDFMIDTENDRLETKLYENIKLKMNRTTGLSELNAWRNSLKEMYITLNDSDIPKDAGVAIEYNIPQTSKRIDFLRHNDYLNAAKEKREALNDSQFIEYLYNRAYAMLYLLRIKHKAVDEDQRKCETCLQITRLKGRRDWHGTYWTCSN